MAYMKVTVNLIGRSIVGHSQMVGGTKELPSVRDVTATISLRRPILFSDLVLKCYYIIKRALKRVKVVLIYLQSH